MQYVLLLLVMLVAIYSIKIVKWYLWQDYRLEKLYDEFVKKDYEFLAMSKADKFKDYKLVEEYFLNSIIISFQKVDKAYFLKKEKPILKVKDSSILDEEKKQKFIDQLNSASTEIKDLYQTEQRLLNALLKEQKPVRCFFNNLPYIPGYKLYKSVNRILNIIEKIILTFDSTSSKRINITDTIKIITLEVLLKLCIILKYTELIIYDRESFKNMRVEIKKMKNDSVSVDGNMHTNVNDQKIKRVIESNDKNELEKTKIRKNITYFEGQKNINNEKYDFLAA